VEVFILDENDNDPVFVDGGTVKVVQVTEGNRVGAVVTRLTATDRDQGLNARLRYSIRAVDDIPDNALEMIADSGELVATTSLDYELRREYR